MSRIFDIFPMFHPFFPETTGGRKDQISKCFIEYAKAYYNKSRIMEMKKGRLKNGL
jgi:hypothetical protein